VAVELIGVQPVSKLSSCQRRADMPTEERHLGEVRAGRGLVGMEVVDEQGDQAEVTAEGDVGAF
jgi:hypothetical protein